RSSSTSFRRSALFAPLTRNVTSSAVLSSTGVSDTRQCPGCSPGIATTQRRVGGRGRSRLILAPNAVHVRPWQLHVVEKGPARHSIIGFGMVRWDAPL